MRIHEIITEGRDALLYHNIDTKKAAAVFSNNSLPALWQHDFPGLGRIKGNSFTRNRSFYGYYNIQLVVDQSKIAQTNKIIPVNAELIHQLNMRNHELRNYGMPTKSVRNFGLNINDRNKRNRDRMDEEFVVGDLNNLNKYLIGIRVYNFQGSGDYDIERLAYNLNNYVKKYKVPLLIGENSKKALQNAMRRAKRNNRNLDSVSHATDKDDFFNKYHGNVKQSSLFDPTDD